MARSRQAGVRLRALALAVVLLGGGFALPAIDAVLYHYQIRAPEAQAAQPQLADASAPLGHAFRCTLDNALPGPRLAAAFQELPRLARLAPTADTPPPISAPRTADRHRFPQPRSPPVTPA